MFSPKQKFGFSACVSHGIRFVLVFALLATTVFSYTRVYTQVATPEPVYAATSSTVSFQARLLTSAGNTVPDGYYNIQFKLYDGGTQGGPGGTGEANAGTLLWTETRDYDGTDDRVRVVNGYFSVNLGSVTAFAGTINWDQEHWLTMSVRGSGTCIFASTCTPADAEMLAPGNKRTKLTAVPYAFAAGQLKKQTGGANTTGTLEFATLTADRKFIIPDTTLATTASPGTICVFNGATSNCPAATGSAFYIQNATATQTLQLDANFNIQATDSGVNGSVGGIIRGAADGQTVDLFQLQASNGTILTAFQSDGKLVFGPSGSQDTNLYRSAANTLKTDDNFIVQTAANSTTAFQIQNAAGTSNLFVADTTNTRIGIGTAAPSDTLEVVGNIVSKGTSWTARSASGNDDSWNAIAYGNGLFVAVSSFGDRVMTSPDGINWTARSAAGDNDTWYAVTYGNGLFVAVGYNGDRVMTSPDGINWTARSAAGDNDSWYGVTYGNGLFVAVSGGGDRVMTSPDGINWTARSAAGDNDVWESVTYGNGLYVAVADSGGDRVMTSPDGINWTARSAAGNNDAWYDVTYGNGLFVAISYSGDRVITSPDGINWTIRSAAGDNDTWYGVTYGNGVFVAVGETGGDVAMTSPDGITWTARSAAGNDDSWNSVIYGNGLFVSVSYGGDRVMNSGRAESSSVSHNNIYHGGQTVYGSSLFKSDANSTTALQVQNAAGTDVLKVDTTNSITSLRGINSAATLGAEKVTNGTFTGNATGWTLGTGWAYNSNNVTKTAGTASDLEQNVSSVNGERYRVTFLTYFHTAGCVTPEIGGVLGAAVCSTQTNTQIITATGSGNLKFKADASYNGTVDNVSVMLLTSSNSVLNVLNSDATTGLEVRSGGSGLNNSFIGVNSGRYTTTSNNSAFGANSLQTNINGSNLTAIGSGALQNNINGSDNTAVGSNTLQSNTTGYQNSALGKSALQSNTTGTDNTAIGRNALNSNTTGNDNTAIGSGSMNYGTTGSSNVALGSYTLESNNGSNNTALGFYSLALNNTGSYNVAIGSNSMWSSDAGNYNVAVGESALYYTDSGNNNIALGRQAGVTSVGANANYSGSNNAFIGYQSGPGTSTQLQGATAIGTYAVVSQSHSLVLGCINGVNGCTATTKIGIGDAAPSTLLSLGGTGSANGITLGDDAADPVSIYRAATSTLALGASIAQFTEVAGTRTLTVETRTTNAAGSGLTVSGGAAGAGGSAFTGGTLTLQGGSAAGTGNANGANVVLQGGSGVGTGVQGLVSLASSVFTASATETSGVSFTIAQSKIDNNSTIPINATATGLTVTVPAPTQNVVGRILYITAVSGSNTFTLSPSGSSTISLPANSTATLVWNGAAWTGAGVDSGSSAYIQNQSSQDQTANFRINGTGQANTSYVSPLFKSLDSSGGGNSANVIFQSGDQVSGSGTSGSVTIKSGDASSGNRSSGNVSVDVGAKSGSGTTGTLSIGTTNASAITIGNATSGLNLAVSTAQFTEVTGTRTFTVQTRTTNVAGSNLTVQGGTAGSGGSAFTGGTLTLQGGNAAGTGNANGANVVLRGGTGVGTGVSGIVEIDTPVFTASSTQTFGSNGTISQAVVDSNSTIPVNATAGSLTITLPAPTNTTVGRIIYVTSVNGSNSFTIAPSGGTNFVMNANMSGTFIWNGVGWTNAGVDGGSNSYIQNQNAVQQTANYRISGTGQADTGFLGPNLERATVGTLSLGTTANSTAISLGRSGITTTNAGALTVSEILTASATGKTAITISDSGAQDSGITIGGDTNIYRSAANTLKTDDALTVAGAATLQSTLTVTGNSDFTGSLAFKKGTDYSTTGSANNVNFGEASLIRLTGASAQTITGIANGRDGEVLTFINTAGQAATLSNNSASSSDGNKIIIGTGSDLTLAAGASIYLVYDSTGTAATSFWRVVGSTGGGTCGTCANQALSNLASVNINTALNRTSGDLAIQTTTSGNINITPATASELVNVLTGNLKVGDGTPTVSLNGEDAYIEGTLEVDGNVNFAGTITSGTWNGSLITSTYGGTGANLSGMGAGVIPYFSATGVLGGGSGNFKFDVTNQYLNVGAAVTGSQGLSVRPAGAGYKGIVVQGNPSQTANLQEFQNDSGTVLSKFDANGILGGANGSGSNVAGSALTIAGGQGTGSAVGGNILFQYAPAGGAGSSLNALQTACTISGTNGSLSCPGSGASSERFGAGSTTSTYTGSLAVGASASVGGNSGTAIGQNAQTTSGEGTALGNTALAWNGATALGYQATATGQRAIAIGTDSDATSSNAIAIGFQSNATFANSIAFGVGSTTTAANQLVVGGSGTEITNAYIGNGVTNAAPTAFTLQGTGSSTNGTAGAAVTIQGGAGTVGNSNGGNLLLNGGAKAGTGIVGHVILQGTNSGYVGIGDTSPSVKLSLGGTGTANGIIFGDDAADPVNLYRAGVNHLRTDDIFSAYAANVQITLNPTVTPNSTGRAFEILGSNGITSLDFGITSSNIVEFGSDVNKANLYRSANDTLRTDDDFVVGTDLTVSGGDINSGSATINLFANATPTAINIGTGAVVRTTTLGSTETTSTTTIQAGTGNINFNAATAQFTESASTRTLTAQTRTTAAAGTAVTISGGTAGNVGTAFSGGLLTLQGGAAAGTGNANGGAVTIAGGAAVGTSTQGLVNLSTTAFTSASVQTFASAGTFSITAGNVDLYSSLPVTASVTGVTISVPDPGQTEIGRVLYIAGRSGSSDFTLRLNAARTPIDIGMKANSTATLIWNGTDWTAAGASSSTDLQSAYNNTLTAAGGAEIVLNNTASANGLTVRNNATTPIVGGILEVQTSIGSNLLSVNNNATEYAKNGGAETAGGTSTTFPAGTWAAAPAGGTVARHITAGANIATGQASASVVTTSTPAHGAANTLSTTLTPNLKYSVSYAIKADSASFSALDTMFSADGTATGTMMRECVSGTPTYSTGTASQSTTTITGVGTTWTAAMVGQIFVFANGTTARITAFGSTTSLTASVSQTVSSQNYAMYAPGKSVTTTGWARVTCTFLAPASGITSSNAIFIRQTDNTARTYYIDNLSVTVSADVNHAADGSVDDATNFTTNWTDFDGGTGSSTISRDTTTLYDTSASAKAVTTADANQGIRNNMLITPQVSTQYLVTFYAKASVAFSNITVGFLPAGGTSVPASDQLCKDYNTQTVSTTGFTKITCIFTTPSSGITNPDLVIYQPTGVARDIYIDALTITLNTNTASNVQIGGANKGGPTTLLTLDRASTAPIAANNDAYLGSMYYDTTTGRIQCYEADGWGACGSAPDNFVILTPEYTGAVLNGAGVGTMTADFCANQTSVLVVGTLCGSGNSRQFYKWTSPQATMQLYSIYVSYKLPSTFKTFISDDTVNLTGRTSNTTDGNVKYEVFRSSGSAITACGTETDVTNTTDGANFWSTKPINGNEQTSCSFVAGDNVILKINVRAQNNANVYVENLTFTYSNN